MKNNNIKNVKINKNNEYLVDLCMKCAKISSIPVYMFDTVNSYPDLFKDFIISEDEYSSLQDQIIDLIVSLSNYALRFAEKLSNKDLNKHED